jgi:hypothetical protein
MISKNVILVFLVAILGMSTLTTAMYLDEVFAKDTNLDKNDYATNFVVRFIDQGGVEHVFYTFSKMDFVKSSGIKFQLDSIPSKDKEQFYEFVSQSMKNTNSIRFDISIDLLAADGSLIETLNYKKCLVEEYFVYVNDSKGKFSFLEDANSKLEIRDATQFECAGFTIDV